MNNMASAIVPKSDQINADDLISGPRTVTISGVQISPGEQPVTIHYAGDDDRPFKPCKSMCRVMVALWGPDANAYIGRSMTLYRDPSVRWGGLEVGGIRISNMSHIDGPHTMALTQTKGSKKAFTVRPLADAPPAAAAPPAATAPRQGYPLLDAAMNQRRVSPGVWLDRLGQVLDRLESAAAVRAYDAAMGAHIGDVHALDPAMAEAADRQIALRLAKLMLPDADEVLDPADAGEVA